MKGVSVYRHSCRGTEADRSSIVVRHDPASCSGQTACETADGGTGGKGVSAHVRQPSKKTLKKT